MLDIGARKFGINMLEAAACLKVVTNLLCYRGKTSFGSSRVHWV